MKKLSYFLCAVFVLTLFAGCTPCDEDAEEIRSAKPVIYLYPDEDACDETKDAKPVIYLYPDEDACDEAEDTKPVYPEENEEDDSCDEFLFAKPLIYLTPESGLDVSVRLDYDGTLTCTYPSYDDGWYVHAAPDGTLTDLSGQTYRYLYWEGISDTQFDFSRGFCVAGADTAAFLEDALERLGLTRTEANEFIIYWLPQMEPNAYNLIAFQTDAYINSARLTITPEPDTLLRVFMAWKPLDTPVEIPAQTLCAPERTGFVAVEWGGAQVLK